MEQAFAGPDPIDEVTQSAAHDQTEGDIVQSMPRIERREKVTKEQQCDERPYREKQRVLGAKTENAGAVLEMREVKEAFDDRNGFMNIERTDHKKFGDPIEEDYEDRNRRCTKSCLEP